MEFQEGDFLRIVEIGKKDILFKEKKELIGRTVKFINYYYEGGERCVHGKYISCHIKILEGKYTDKGFFFSRVKLEKRDE